MLPTPCDHTDPVHLAGLAVDALGDAFGDEAAFDADMTARALDALGTCVTYLRDCLGPARTVAIPDPATLARVLLTAHVACWQLHAGLQAALTSIDRRQWPQEQARMPVTTVAALRAALAAACGALADAATGFAAAHAAATQLATPQARNTGRAAPACAPTQLGTSQPLAETGQPTTDQQATHQLAGDRHGPPAGSGA